MTASACGSCGSAVQDATICTGCTRDLAELLLLAASISTDLDDAVAKLLKRGGGGRSSETSAPLPVDLAASEVARALHMQLAACAAVLHIADLELPWPDGDIASIARWLAARLGDIRQHETAPRMLSTVRDAVHRAIVVIDRQPERVPAGQCEACGTVLLADLETDTATCRCGNVVTGLIDERYRRATEADQLGTPAELVGYCRAVGVTVKRGTITSWVTRKQLLPRPGGAFALSDVLALKAQGKTRVRG